MQEILETAQRYRNTAAIIGRAHYIAWENAAKWNNWLGIPVIVTTSIVGTTIFATINEEPEVGWKIAAGLISLLAAVLSALQTSLKFSENAEKYRAAGAGYAAMRKKLDLFRLHYSENANADRQSALNELESIIEELNKLAKESPSIKDKNYDKAEREQKAKYDKSFALLPRDQK